MCSNEFEEKNYILSLRRKLLEVGNNPEEAIRVLSGARKLIHMKNADKFNLFVRKIALNKATNEKIREEIREIFSLLLG